MVFLLSASVFDSAGLLRVNHHKHEHQRAEEYRDGGSVSDVGIAEGVLVDHNGQVGRCPGGAASGDHLDQVIVCLLYTSRCV